MKIAPSITLIAGLFLILPACDKNENPAATTTSAAKTDLKNTDIPLLPITKGDSWTYSVHIEIPLDVTSPGADEVELKQERTRTYLGKVRVNDELPDTDAFDVTSPGLPTQREFVEIHEDRILLRGNARPDLVNGTPLWIDPPFPFVIAGMRPGEELPSLHDEDGNRTRGIKIIARETIKVPAGEYPTIRLLMTGQDGKIETHRTTWFAPGIGIVKEEKANYAEEKLLLRETAELISTTVSPPSAD